MGRGSGSGTSTRTCTYCGAYINVTDFNNVLNFKTLINFLTNNYAIIVIYSYILYAIDPYVNTYMYCSLLSNHIGIIRYVMYICMYDERTTHYA